MTTIRPSTRLRSACALVALPVLLIASGNAIAAGYSYHTLHNFGGRNAGRDPEAGLIEDAGGAILFGTTSVGDTFAGEVFEGVNVGGTWKITRIHKFPTGSTKDGSTPYAPLIEDKNGALYGTTCEGGKYYDPDVGQYGGVIFSLTYQGGTWSEKIIHNFGKYITGPNSEQCPMTGLTYHGQKEGDLWDPDVNAVYGTTSAGGSDGNGVVFRLKYTGSGWNYKVIHTFTSGFYPNELQLDSSDNLYGSTVGGGKYGGGTLYKLTYGTWKETTLHNFCAQDGPTGCTDGAFPVGRQWRDSNENMYGTAACGGSGAGLGICVDGVTGGGVVYEYTSDGTYEVLYNFCSLAKCVDGANPSSGMIMDGSGILYGTFGASTYSGSDTTKEGAFELIPSGDTWTESVIATHTGLTNPLRLDPSNGFLYSTCPQCGGDGSVFVLEPD